MRSCPHCLTRRKTRALNTRRPPSFPTVNPVREAGELVQVLAEPLGRDRVDPLRYLGLGRRLDARLLS